MPFPHISHFPFTASQGKHKPQPQTKRTSSLSQPTKLFLPSQAQAQGKPTKLTGIPSLFTTHTLTFKASTPPTINTHPNPQPQRRRRGSLGSVNDGFQPARTLGLTSRPEAHRREQGKHHHRDHAAGIATATATNTPLPSHLQPNPNKSLSRKIVHVLSGVLFMSSWPFFSDSTEARFFAAVVPLLNCIRLLTYGLRLYTDETLVKSVTREGKPEELLRGPLYYVMVLLFSVLVFWRESPIGIVSLSMMSGGDGFADIVGRRYGSLKLPFNKKKSWIGSIAMFISGFLLSALMLFYFSCLGYIQVSWELALGKLLLVALAATVVECIPVTDIVDDNISVPLASMLVAFLLFCS